ncbi:hypothetical protein HNQ60_002853 [Povalibacter uvarum]|uniref:Uncharacterized protein n=1 Tax=Povalibacter uvarum TaxID=732238 RepID=A0A841HPI7_9GAMM|nr:hypothetical protein [Povalibacter uvarum]MBB6093972.1 hypothetical protein [Povalibacter uvarum]
MKETEDGHDVISRYRTVAREVPDETVDERILGISVARTRPKAAARTWYALAASVVAAVIAIGLHQAGTQRDVIVTGATDTFGLIEGNSRAFLLGQTGAEGVGPGDSLFVRMEDNSEED